MTPLDDLVFCLGAVGGAAAWIGHTTSDPILVQAGLFVMLLTASVGLFTSLLNDMVAAGSEET